MPVENWRHIITKIGNYLVFILSALSVNEYRNLRKTFIFLTIGVVIISIMTIMHSLGYISLPVEMHRSRSLGSYSIPFQRTLGVPIDYGLYGMLTLPVLSLLVVSIFSGRKLLFQNNMLSVLFSLVILFGIFVSQSRSTWLATLISMGMIILLLSKIRIYTFCFASALLIGVAYLERNIILKFIETIINISPEGVYIRIFMNKLALDFFTRHLLFGIGYTSLHLYFGVHNNFSYQLMSRGLFGFLPYIGLIILTLVIYYKIGIKSENKELSLYSIGLLSGFIGMLVELQFFLGFSIKIFWMLIGLANSLYIMNKNVSK